VISAYRNGIATSTAGGANFGLLVIALVGGCHASNSDCPGTNPDNSCAEIDAKVADGFLERDLHGTESGVRPRWLEDVRAVRGAG